MRHSSKAFSALLVNAVLFGCGGATQPPPTIAVATTDDIPKPVQRASYDGVERLTFNRLATRLNAPVYWVADRNGNQSVEADEIATLTYYPTDAKWVEAGKFTLAFDALWRRLEVLNKEGDALDALPPAEAARRIVVSEELDQGLPTLVYNDLRGLKDNEKRMVIELLATSRLIDQLYQQQNGTAELAAQLKNADPASQSLFRRNFGPRCMAPKTENNPSCSALPGNPKPLVSAYPTSLQKNEKFCEELEKRADAKALLDPFIVVRDSGSKLEAVPLTEAYKPFTAPIAESLLRAVGFIDEAQEPALKAYLLAAAKAFGDNNWQPADEAWAKMNAENSKWYVRVAPDETYWEPCNRKAGFHLTFARINTESLIWQRKLVPVQQQLEDALAKLIGAPYKARKVSFHMPDFIDIVSNAGNDRMPFGATVGQSLPNWGPVANEGRGRTVVMSNLYTDFDSRAIRRDQATSLLAPETMKVYSESQTPQLVGIIIHEAAHNLGPSHEYKYQGKTDDQGFGGPLATVLEELKAQSAALWFVDFLKTKGIIDQALAEQTYVSELTWSFGHIAQGMRDAQGRPKPYSQLAAIQLGILIKEGAVTFDKDAVAANGVDKGAFTIHLNKLPQATLTLMQTVGRIKAKNDKKSAQKLIAEYVDGQTALLEEIGTRWLRQPKASFVYAIDI